MLQPKKQWDAVIEQRLLDPQTRGSIEGLTFYLFTVEKSSFAKFERIEESQAEGYMRESKFSRD